MKVDDPDRTKTPSEPAVRESANIRSTEDEEMSLTVSREDVAAAVSVYRRKIRNRRDVVLNVIGVGRLKPVHTTQRLQGFGCKMVERLRCVIALKPC